MTIAERQDFSSDIAPRDPDVVMRLSRMGSAHPMRLSFLRVLLRRLQTEGWRFDRPLWEVDDRGVGRAVMRSGYSRSARSRYSRGSSSMLRIFAPDAALVDAFAAAHARYRAAAAAIAAI